jgi:cytochrome c
MQKTRLIIGGTTVRLHKSVKSSYVFIIVAIALNLLAMPLMAATFNADTAQALLKESKCFKCHAVDKKKDGPAYRDVAAKFRADADAEKKLIHHVTSGDKVKFADGHEEDHKKVKTSDMTEIKNLVYWMQSLEGGTKY